jgi:hypothetical protein
MVKQQNIRIRMLPGYQTWKRPGKLWPLIWRTALNELSYETSAHTSTILHFGKESQQDFVFLFLRNLILLMTRFRADLP